MHPMWKQPITADRSQSMVGHSSTGRGQECGSVCLSLPSLSRFLSHWGQNSSWAWVLLTTYSGSFPWAWNLTSATRVKWVTQRDLSCVS